MTENLTDNQVMSVILEYLISLSTNKEYVEKLNIILKGIKGKKHIEETDSPRYQSILLFGYNIFPFTMMEYREIAKTIIKEK